MEAPKTKQLGPSKLAHSQKIKTARKECRRGIFSHFPYVKFHLRGAVCLKRVGLYVWRNNMPGLTQLLLQSPLSLLKEHACSLHFSQDVHRIYRQGNTVLIWAAVGNIVLLWAASCKQYCSAMGRCKQYCSALGYCKQYCSDMDHCKQYCSALVCFGPFV